MGQLVIKNKQW